MATREQVTVQVMKDKPARVDAFGCNGKDAQTAVTVNAAVPNASTNPAALANAVAKVDYDVLVALVNQLRSTLIANGICA